MSDATTTNARWLITSKAGTKLADLLCNAKTTLPWLVGRKTYVVDVAKGGERPQFVASSNTLVALALLGAGAGQAAVPTASAALNVCAVATGLGALGCVGLAKA